VKMKNQKRIWLPSSSECSKAKIFFLDSTPFFALSFALSWWFCSSLVWATLPANQNPSDSEILQRLKSEMTLREMKGESFENLTQQWEKSYGTRAFSPLLQIAKTRSNSDFERYVALMSAAKLGGTGAVTALRPFLRDPSWLIRGGAIRALTAIGDSQTGELVLPLVNDPALVVRVEVVQAIRVLRPKGAAHALLFILNDKSNYHAGKAQWAPQKALLAMTSLPSPEAIPALKSYLVTTNRDQRDPEFRHQVLLALGRLGERKE
jgi:hypothetical protein